MAVPAITRKVTSSPTGIQHTMSPLDQSPAQLPPPSICFTVTPVGVSIFRFKPDSPSGILATVSADTVSGMVIVQLSPDGTPFATSLPSLFTSATDVIVGVISAVASNSAVTVTLLLGIVKVPTLLLVLSAVTAMVFCCSSFTIQLFSV